jgi:RNA polymerase sigma-70 factor (ECF subfamily)
MAYLHSTALAGGTDRPIRRQRCRPAEKRLTHFGFREPFRGGAAPLWAMLEAVSTRYPVVEAPRETQPAETFDFDQLYEAYVRYVAHIGWRLLGRDDEVDDLVQDVFLAAHRGARRLRDPEAIRGWMATVTVRLAKRRLRKRRLMAAISLDSAPDYLSLADKNASPENRALLAQVYSALDRLPTNQRIAWTLRYLEGERLDSIAGLCRCSLATAKRRIKAAHDTLRREVAHG